jgi:hypothetical protein
MQPFHEVRADDLSPSLMQHEIATRGYVLIRNVIPWLDLMLLMREIAQILFREGWLMPGYDPLRRLANIRAACGDPDPAFKRIYQEVFGLERFHGLPHHPALTAVMKMLVGDHVLVHPKPIGRLIFPHCESLTVHAHQDYRFMRGDPECYTAWIPLHDCPINVGPLRILEGSHRLGPINHDSENLHVPEIGAKTLMKGSWVGGRVNAGDVLVFHSLTVHAASPNISNKLRISLDCRFQDYRRAINPANLAFAGDSGKSWENIYGTWRCDDLKFYWKRLPLTFQPSKSEIERLAATAESVDARSRYARILTQLN